ncbi:MAG TPA: CocE/NonD family hydrolase, partial [Pyrinomonadaceae bacterium]|nr:CocE/NonD family hydrolase [Pyrinomonadaceae bacterium]
MAAGVAAPPPAQTAAARQAQSPPDGQRGGGAPRYKGYAEPAYREISVNSHYVTMRDGVRIAVDVLLPKGLPPAAKIPTLLSFTRYWRARDGAQPDNLQKFFVGHGYALVMVDVRGTGASFGVWTAPWSTDEVKDYGEVVSWVVVQPWSDGKMGAFGSSYGGNAVLHLASLKHPAVKAVLPRHFEFDEYLDVPFPGGVPNDWLVKTWDESNRELDKGASVKPVAGDADRSLLRLATKEHEKNIDLYGAARQVVFRDDRLATGAGQSTSLDDISVHMRVKEISRSKTAVGAWGGWFDAGTADAVIKSFQALDNPQRAVIGPWNHGASQNASPYFSENSQRVSIMFEWLRFFDQHLKGIDTGLSAGKVLFYYTIGEERWKATGTWPVAGTKMARWYVAADNALSSSSPQADAGADTYKVDFEASTGEKNRWRTQLGGPVVYPDRAAEDARLLTYTSPPLAADTEITGHPVVTLHVTSTHRDGAFFVYLEEVDEAGRV